MNNEVNIRTKNDEDLENIFEVVKSFVKDSFATYSDEYYPSSIVDEWNKKAKVFLVLETGDNVIGFGFVASYKQFKSFKSHWSANIFYPSGIYRQRIRHKII